MATSISDGGTFSPLDITIMSFTRPVIVICPDALMEAMSPVFNQPSPEIIAAVASGFFQ